LVLDFDGTVTSKDIGDEVASRFAPPSWREIDDAWVRNEISLPEAQRRIWALARCERDEAVAWSREVGVLRPGLEPLLAAVERSGGLAWLASGGFDFYIEALLAGQLGRFQRTWFNRTRFIDGRVEIDFAEAAIGCERCAVCKGKVCDAARAEGARVVFVGDGASDRCVIGRADVVCAVAGSLLARTCEERGVAYRPITTLEDVIAAL
jgi:2,3-diketo-5-methylthio-1-phosphopentane phosphatase